MISRMLKTEGRASQAGDISRLGGRLFKTTACFSYPVFQKITGII